LSSNDKCMYSTFSMPIKSENSNLIQVYIGDEVSFKTCVAMKFVNDDDDDISSP